jgi:hypothetical protein
MSYYYTPDAQVILYTATMSDTDYAAKYRDIDFRKHPEKYVIGRGEQGVLIAQPYKDEILPYWKFATPDKAVTSAKKIYSLFEEYGKQNDFVGMDMARKFLQMGFTRSRRYANHASGKKYDESGTKLKQDAGSEESNKAESARIFKEYYDKARMNQTYAKLKEEHKKRA